MLHCDGRSYSERVASVQDPFVFFTLEPRFSKERSPRTVTDLCFFYGLNYVWAKPKLSRTGRVRPIAIISSSSPSCSSTGRHGLEGAVKVLQHCPCNPEVLKVSVASAAFQKPHPSTTGEVKTYKCVPE
jgi:hypothetical protein